MQASASHHENYATSEMKICFAGVEWAAATLILSINQGNKNQIISY